MASSPSGIGDTLRQALEGRWWSSPEAAAPWLPDRLLLRPLAALYGGLVALNRRAHALGLLHSGATPLPVVVVGNLVAGGAGKTPTVIALVQALRAAGRRPGVISRGHGGSASGQQAVSLDSPASVVGDEPLLIRRRTGVPVWVGRDRVAVAAALCAAEPAVDVLVADDGLQHRALRRDAQVLVIDRRGFGNGRLLPAGPLREPPWRSVPPRTAIVYNAPAPVTPLPGGVARARLGPLLPLDDWWNGRQEAALDPAELRGQPLLAAAAIAEPARFFDLLQAHGLQARRLPLPDHDPLLDRPWGDGSERLLVTEKDAVKLRPGHPDAGRIVVVALDFALPPGLVGQLLPWLSPRPPSA